MFKKLAKIEQLVVYGVLPIGTVMHTWAFRVVVRYVQVKELFVEGLVHPVKEITSSYVDQHL